MLLRFGSRVCFEAPEEVAESWPSILAGAAFSVSRVARQEVEPRYPISGVVRHRSIDTPAARIRLLEGRGARTQCRPWTIDVSGGPLAYSLSRVLVSCGCKLNLRDAPRVCHCMFSGNLCESTNEMLRRFDGLLYPDCREPEIGGIVNAIAGERLDEYVRKAGQRATRLIAFLGRSEFAGFYVAIGDHSLNHTQWLGSTTYSDLRNEWNRIGFSELDIFTKSVGPRGKAE